jgi:FlaA1/EpsC-like NDP-sugar epimerase
MFLPFSISYALFYILTTKEKKLFASSYLLFAILLGLGLSAIFWSPAILERQYVTGLQVFNFSDHFPEFYQLIIPSWGSGFSSGALQDQLSFQIGIANLIAVFISVLVLLIYRRKNEKSLIIIFFVVCFFIIFFLMLKVSKPVWEHISFMNYFQFPWRFLSLEILFASFLAGSIIYFSKSKILAVGLILLSFILGIGYAKPAYYHYRNDNYYITRPNFIDGTNSSGNAFNTVFLKGIPKKEKGKAVFLKGNGKIEQKIVKSTMYVLKIKAESNSEILINTAYFPGWKVNVNRSEVKINNKNGTISFLVPKGEHVVNVLFKNTLVRTIATFISIASFFVLIFLFKLRLFGTIKK